MWAVWTYTFRHQNPPIDPFSEISSLVDSMVYRPKINVPALDWRSSCLLGKSETLFLAYAFRNVVQLYLVQLTVIDNHMQVEKMRCST